MDENDSGIVRLRQIPGHFLSIHRCGEPAASDGEEVVTRAAGLFSGIRHYTINVSLREWRINS